MNNDLLKKKLDETITTLEKFAAVGSNPKALQPMIETVRAAKRRLAQFVEDGPAELTARDQVALRMLPMTSEHLDMAERMLSAYKLADSFLEARHGEMI